MATSAATVNTAHTMKVGTGAVTFVWRKILPVSAALKPLAITAENPVMEFARTRTVNIFRPMMMVTFPVNTPVAAAATGAGTSVPTIAGTVLVETSKMTRKVSIAVYHMAVHAPMMGLAVMEMPKMQPVLMDKL